MNPLIMKALGSGAALQVAMVVIGHFLSPDQQSLLFPIVGTLLGGVTGWMAGPSSPTASGRAANGAVTGGVAGALGSLMSTSLGDAPLSNIAIAGGATVVSGAVGALLRRR